ncbi:MAG: imidazolonepropionase, partial [Alphaproteobacteria bacterium]|nr:imidazolonepropionase [Alphaproteobacteria bacterium]
MWDSLWTNAVVATMKPGRPYGLIEQGAVGIAAGRIAWVGPVA